MHFIPGNVITIKQKHPGLDFAKIGNRIKLNYIKKDANMLRYFFINMDSGIPYEHVFGSTDLADRIIAMISDNKDIQNRIAHPPVTDAF